MVPRKAGEDYFRLLPLLLFGGGHSSQESAVLQKCCVRAGNAGQVGVCLQNPVVSSVGGFL